MSVVLSNRNYALLWLGGLISTLGDWVLLPRLEDAAKQDLIDETIALMREGVLDESLFDFFSQFHPSTSQRFFATVYHLWKRSPEQAERNRRE